MWASRQPQGVQEGQAPLEGLTQGSEIGGLQNAWEGPLNGFRGYLRSVCRIALEEDELGEGGGMSKAMSETAKRETGFPVYRVRSGSPPTPRRISSRQRAKRYCEWCPNKVTRYTKRQCKNGPLLCSRCVDGFDPIAHRQGTRMAKDGRKKDTPPREPGLSLPTLRDYKEGAG